MQRQLKFHASEPPRFYQNKTIIIRTVGCRIKTDAQEYSGGKNDP